MCLKTRERERKMKEILGRNDLTEKMHHMSARSPFLYTIPCMLLNFRMQKNSTSFVPTRDRKLKCKDLDELCSDLLVPVKYLTPSVGSFVGVQNVQNVGEMVQRTGRRPLVRRIRVSSDSQHMNRGRTPCR